MELFRPRAGTPGRHAARSGDRARDSGQTTVEWLGVMALIVAVIAAVITLGAPVRRQVSTSFNTQACRVTNDCGGGGPLSGISSLVGAAGGAAAADSLDLGLLDSISDAATGALEGGGGLVGGIIGGVSTGIGGALDGGSALLNGLVLGDYGSPEDGAVLEGIRIGGQILSSIVIVGDVRDGTRAATSVITTGEGWDDLVLIGVGLIPVGGDIARGVGIIGESAVDATRAVDDVADAAGDIVRQGDEVVAAGDDVVERFPSTDPQVPQTASAIEDAYPGAVQDHNVDVFRPDGTKLTDLDIVTDQAVVEVKTGRARGIGAQVDRITEAMAQEGLGGRQLVVYMPDMPASSAAAREATRRGALVVHNLDELVGILGP